MDDYDALIDSLGSPAKKAKPPVDYRALYQDVGKKHGVDPDLLYNQAKQESVNFNPHYVYGPGKSPKGAAGLSQFMPDTAKQYGLYVGKGRDDRYNPRLAADAQARMMKDLIAKHGDATLALAAYNSGHNKTSEQARRSAQRIPETRGYVQKIAPKGDKYDQLLDGIGDTPTPQSAAPQSDPYDALLDSLDAPAGKKPSPFARVKAGVGAAQDGEWRPQSMQSQKKLFETPKPSPRTGTESLLETIGGREKRGEDIQNILEGVTGAVAGTGRQLANAQELGMRVTPIGIAGRELSKRATGFDPQAIPSKINDASHYLESAVAENEAARPAPTTFAGNVRRGVGKGVGASVVEMPKLLLGGIALKAANLPVQGALSRADEGLPGIIKGAAGGLVYHYGGALTGKAFSGVSPYLAKVGNSLVWIAGPVAEQQIAAKVTGSEAPNLAQSIGENIPFGIMAGMGAKGKVRVKTRSGERDATEADLPKILKKELEVVPPERTEDARQPPRYRPELDMEAINARQVEAQREGVLSVPERPETIKAQLDARGYSLIPNGTSRPSIPRGYRAEKTADGVVFYDPNRISRETIRNTPTAELLGHIEEKSPATTEAVVAKTPEGTEIQSSAVSPENIGKQAELMAERYPEAKIETGGPELASEVIAERVQPQRFHSLRFGDVEVTESQEGARTGKIRVAEVGNPEAIHYVKKVDLQGRGNAQLLPIKESAEVLPEAAPAEKPQQPPEMKGAQPAQAKTTPPSPETVRVEPAEAGSVVERVDRSIVRGRYYHGTPTEFGTYKLPEGRGRAVGPNAYYFSSNPVEAETYATNPRASVRRSDEFPAESSPNIRPVYLDVKNVFDTSLFNATVSAAKVTKILDGIHRNADSDLQRSPEFAVATKALKSLIGQAAEVRTNAINTALQRLNNKNSDVFRQALVDAGYDGYKATTSEIAVFSPQQIISAFDYESAKGAKLADRPIEPQKPETTSVEQGVELKTIKGDEAQTPQLPVQGSERQSVEPIQPQIVKPWEMSRSEIEAEFQRKKSEDDNLEVSVLGPELAKRYKRLQQSANSSYDTKKADAAYDEIQKIEASLSETDRNRLYGIGETGPQVEDLRAYRQSLGNLDDSSPQALGDSMRWAVSRVGNETDPLKMNQEQQIAFGTLREAARIAHENGWDTQKVSEVAVKAAGERFSDPDDARMMLDRFLIKEPSPTRVEPKQIASPKVSEQPIKEASNVVKEAEVSERPKIGGLGAGVQGAPARETAPAPTKSEAGFLNPKLAKEGVYSPATSPVLKQVENATLNGERQRPTLSQYTRKAKSYIQRALIAEFTPLRELEQKLYGNKSVPVVNMARKFEQVAGAPAKAEADIIDFRRNVVDPIRKSADDFNSYLFLKRVEDRLMKEPERKRVADWTVEKARAGLAELETKVGADTYKELAKAGKVYQTEMDKALRLQVESGRMSEDLYNTIKESNDFYAPFKVLRYIEDADIVRGSGRRIATTQELAKKIKGIDSEDFQLGSILQASAEQIVRSRILAEKNLKMLELDKLADRDPKGELIKRITEDKARPDQGKEFVRFLKDGKEQILEVDSVVAHAVQGLNPRQAGLMATVMMKARKPLQVGATSANASFQAVNLFFADLPRAALVSRYGVRSVRDIYQFPMDWTYSLFTSMKGNFGNPNRLYMDWLRSGAANSTIQRELTPEAFRPTLGLAKPGAKHLASSVLNSVAKFSNAIEETSKVLGLKRGMRMEGIAKMSPAERQVAMEKIVTEVRNYSGSPDFPRHGSESPEFNLLFIFFNARVQGNVGDIARLSGRTGKPEAAAAWARIGTAVALPATLLAIVNNLPENKEDYEKIPEWEKSNYFMIPRTSHFINEDTGEQIRDYWRIPKRGVVQLIGNTAESAVQFGLQREPKAAKTWAVDMIENLSPLNVEGRNMGERVESIFGSTNPALKLPAETLMNRDTFRHRSIVPEYMRKAAPAEQYRESTPRGYRMAGKALGVSPLQLEHAVEGATGSAASQFSIRPQQEGRSALGRFPLTRRFVRSGSTATDDDVTQEQTDHATKQLLRRRERQAAVKKYRAGEISKVDLDRMESEGLLTESDTKRVEKEGTQSSRQARFAAAAPNVALDRFERMDDRQRNEVLSLMEKKAYALLNSEALTDAQKEAFDTRIKALGITPRNPRSKTSSRFKSAFGKRFNSQFATQ